MKRASINFFLVLAVCAIAVPILLFFAILLLQLEGNERRALERRMEHETASIASGADRMLAGMAANLSLVATAPELLAGDLASFHARTQQSLANRDLYVVLVASDGKQLLNTRVPFGEDLPMTGNPEGLARVMTAGRLEVSDVFVGRTSGRHVFNVMEPVSGAASLPKSALIMTRDASALVGLLPMQGLPAGWSAAVIDRSGNTVASIGPEGPPAGVPISREVLDNMTAASGVMSIAAKGGAGLAAWAQAGEWPWRSVIWGPVATAQQSILNTWWSLLAGGTLLIAAAIGAALVLARRLERSVMAIAGMADGLARGEIVSPVTSRIAELDAVGKAISNASFDRSEAEEHIRLIMRELAHRTKNLLAIVQAIIRQTARQTSSLGEFEEKVDKRLRGLAVSIDLMTQANRSQVTLRRLIETHLESFADGEGRVEVSGQDIQLKPEAVQNLGLALHELATNALKYGSLSVPEGKVSIGWRWIAEEGGETLELRWVESGGPAVDKPARKGFGTQVIQRHAAAAFQARVELDYAPGGLRWTLLAPRRAVEAVDASPEAAAELGV